MAYCTYQDVQLNLQYLTLTAESKPSINDVTTFCEQISADVDSRLSVVGVTLPITSTDKLSLIKKIVVDGVTAKVFRSLNTEDALSSARAYQEEYDKAITKIENNPRIIDDVQTSSSPGYFNTSGARRKYTREGKDW